MVVGSPSLNNPVSFTNRAGRYSQGTMGKELHRRGIQSAYDEAGDGMGLV